MVGPHTSGSLLERDFNMEENIIRRAATGVVGPDNVIAHSRMRSTVLSGEYVPDPHMIKMGMDRPREALDEIADGINHLLFHLQEFPEGPGCEDYKAAIRFFLLAYDRIANAEHA